ncbi:MAG: HNH endonuclease [Chloroflexi bacterium]|nr:HNH endonuclease [Chloroflexota bacterium]
MSRPYIPVEIRQTIAKLDKRRCAYCLSPEVLSGIGLTFDHIAPVAAGGETSLDNLCLACRSCNEFKNVQMAGIDPESDETIPLFNPRAQRWLEHFRWDESGTLVEGITAVGRITVSVLKLNHSLIIKARTRWVMAGWHPPQDL